MPKQYDTETWHDPGEKRLVGIAENKYILVYIDQGLNLVYAVSPEYAEAAKHADFDQSKLDAILEEVERVQEAYAETLTPDAICHCKEELGKAVAKALEHDYDQANESLIAAHKCLPMALDRGDYNVLWSHIEDRKFDVAVTDQYIVYVNDEDDIDWQTTQTYDAFAPKDPDYDHAANNLLLNRAVVMEATPTAEFPEDTVLRFKTIVASAIASTLDSDYDTARQTLADAGTYIRMRGEEMSRRWYLSSSALVAAAFATVGCILWLARDLAIALLAPRPFWIVLAAAAGAVGALLSVIWRSGKLKFDATAGKSLHYLEGASRIGAGAISGILAGLAVKSGIILGTLAEGNDRVNLIMLIAAMAAGWGERLAPSIISTFESTPVKGAATDDRDDADTDDEPDKAPARPKAKPAPSPAPPRKK